MVYISTFIIENNKFFICYDQQIQIAILIQIIYIYLANVLQNGHIHFGNFQPGIAIISVELQAFI